MMDVGCREENVGVAKACIIVCEMPWWQLFGTFAMCLHAENVLWPVEAPCPAASSRIPPCTVCWQDRRS